MYNFCTLFDKNYLSRGLALYRSLEATGDDFHLYVFAFDSYSHKLLNSIAAEHMTVISLEEFEDPELLRIKGDRTAGEYCWTCTPSTILYCLEKYELPNCTYLDADMYFFSSPSELINEKPEEHSVIITKHRYTPKYDQSKESGIYCVQFVYFQNDEQGLEVLRWWRNACIEWCYARVEDGKFGDQKYLDDWTTRFKGVWVLENPGGGLAPWNVQQYSFYQSGSEISGKVKSSGFTFTPVFFHFHGLKLNKPDTALFAPKAYILSPSVRKFFYHPYVKALESARAEILEIDPEFGYTGFISLGKYLKELLFADNFVTLKLNLFR